MERVEEELRTLLNRCRRKAGEHVRDLNRLGKEWMGENETRAARLGVRAASESMYNALRGYDEDDFGHWFLDGAPPEVIEEMAEEVFKAGVITAWEDRLKYRSGKKVMDLVRQRYRDTYPRYTMIVEELENVRDMIDKLENLLKSRAEL